MTNIMHKEYKKPARFSVGTTILCQLNTERHVPCEIVGVKSGSSYDRHVYLVVPLGGETVGIALDPVESNEESSYEDDLYCNITAKIDPTSTFFKDISTAKTMFRFH